MTREDTKDIRNLWFGEYIKYNTLCRIIDNIYDDFESRTCANCKWFVPHRADIPNEFEGTCDAGVYMDGDNLGDMVSVDFGCNQWEKK